MAKKLYEFIDFSPFLQIAFLPLLEKSFTKSLSRRFNVEQT